MRTTKLGTIIVVGDIKCNNIAIDKVNMVFDSVGQARKFLSRLSCNGNKVNVNGKTPKHGEFYFQGDIFKKVDDGVKRIDKFHY